MSIRRIHEQQPEPPQPTVLRELRDARGWRVGVDDDQQRADSHRRSIGKVCQQPAEARIDVECDEGCEDSDLGRRELEAIPQEVQRTAVTDCSRLGGDEQQRLRIAYKPAVGASPLDRPRDASRDVEASVARAHRRHGLPVRTASVNSASSAGNVLSNGFVVMGPSQLVESSMQISAIKSTKSSMPSQ